MRSDNPMPPCPGTHTCGGYCHAHYTQMIRAFTALVEAQDWTENDHAA